MQFATLQEVDKEKGQVLYDKKSLKVVAICTNNIRAYKNDKGEDKKVLNVAVGDAAMALKFVIYDQQKMSKFVPGNILVLKHIIKKQDNIVITKTSKIFPVPKMEPIILDLLLLLISLKLSGFEILQDYRVAPKVTQCFF